MHPIERLRFVARASGAPDGMIVSETAGALASFGDDPLALVTACRRVVARQPRSGALVWLGARVLTAANPSTEVWEAAGALQADPTATELSHALGQDATAVVIGWPEEAAEALSRRGDVRVRCVDVAGEAEALVDWFATEDVEAAAIPASGLAPALVGASVLLLEASAVGPTDALAAAGSHAAAATARALGVAVWLVVPRGRTMPVAMWDRFVARALPPSIEPWSAPYELVPLGLVDRIAGPKGLVDVDAAVARPECPNAPELFAGDAF